MQAEQRIYYLEMRSPEELRRSRAVGIPLDITQAKAPCPEFSRYLYTAVGGDWYWTDRLVWTYDQWLEYLARPGLETWVAYVSGTPAGYFELDGKAGSDIEIASFGLLPQFIGCGLGGHLLAWAAQRAWQKGAARVWVHTCSLDHPHALANYRARGFRLFKEEVVTKDLPDQPPGPWLGAGRRA